MSGSPAVRPGSSPIHKQFDSGNVTRIVGVEEHCSLGDLLWLSDTPQRSHRSQLRVQTLSFLLGLHQPCNAWSIHRTGLSAFTRIFRSLRSAVHVRAKERTAAFVAE